MKLRFGRGNGKICPLLPPNAPPTTITASSTAHFVGGREGLEALWSGWEKGPLLNRLLKRREAPLFPAGGTHRTPPPALDCGCFGESSRLPPRSPARLAPLSAAQMLNFGAGDPGWTRVLWPPVVFLEGGKTPETELLGNACCPSSSPSIRATRGSESKASEQVSEPRMVLEERRALHRVRSSGSCDTQRSPPIGTPLGDSPTPLLRLEDQEASGGGRPGAPPQAQSERAEERSGAPLPTCQRGFAGKEAAV